MGRKGKETVRFGADKKPRKCLSVPQVFIRTTRVYLLQPYPRRKPFCHARRVCPRRKSFYRTNRIFIRTASGCL